MSKEEIITQMSPIGQREAFIRKFLSSPEAKNISSEEKMQLNTIRKKMEKGLTELDEEYKVKVDKFIFETIDEEYVFLKDVVVPRIKNEHGEN